MTLARYLLLLLVPVALAGCGGAVETSTSTQELGVAESVANVRVPLEAVSQAIEDANRAITAIAVPMTQSQTVSNIAAVRAAIRRSGEQHAEVKLQLARLATLIESTEKERGKLQKDKAALEAKESLLSMGFYASFAGFAALLLIYWFNSPLRKAELELKRLEIKKKELEIRKLESGRDRT